ncbi:MAG TPA: uroporphyrinogen-III C-methyltransferase [Vitreimonas sp.]|uniref:uroporphyrinogen-III C-methyltransferase n=1 Tax=Vitreimonas sp. TaxID=3069702 RepID=UPI002D37E73A|nr:uroporphyrinogen-III C-methyltransferase [Vitreimonas sp.]HYD86876.1 uroporphyrinogen-III C-methyltransferase [Vitreimonas sp.]
MTGTVYLVGAGPGAADLLTLRAARLLSEADVVLHDALVGAEILALAPQARIYNVGKRANRPSVDQRLICRLLVRLAERHRVVVRLKGGDPNLFGRASEEVAACRVAGVPVVTVPGVSAGFAAAASVGTSLTSRGVSRSVAFVTPSVGHGDARNAHWAEAAAAAETAVIYMGAIHAEYVVEELLASGVQRRRPVAVVESASTANERVLRGVLCDLPELVAELGDGPAVIIVGEVAALADALPLAAVSAA